MPWLALQQVAQDSLIHTEMVPARRFITNAWHSSTPSPGTLPCMAFCRVSASSTVLQSISTLHSPPASSTALQSISTQHPPQAPNAALQSISTQRPPAPKCFAAGWAQPPPRASTQRSTWWQQRVGGRRCCYAWPRPGDWPGACQQLPALGPHMLRQSDTRRRTVQPSGGGI